MNMPHPIGDDEPRKTMTAGYSGPRQIVCPEMKIPLDSCIKGVRGM
jgi:hypothetical protein